MAAHFWLVKAAQGGHFIQHAISMERAIRAVHSRFPGLELTAKRLTPRDLAALARTGEQLPVGARMLAQAAAVAERQSLETDRKVRVAVQRAATRAVQEERRRVAAEAEAAARLAERETRQRERRALARKSARNGRLEAGHIAGLAQAAQPVLMAAEEHGDIPPWE